MASWEANKNVGSILKSRPRATCSACSFLHLAQRSRGCAVRLATLSAEPLHFLGEAEPELRNGTCHTTFPLTCDMHAEASKARFAHRNRTSVYFQAGSCTSTSLAIVVFEGLSSQGGASQCTRVTFEQLLFEARPVQCCRIKEHETNFEH